VHYLPADWCYQVADLIMTTTPAVASWRYGVSWAQRSPRQVSEQQVLREVERGPTCQHGLSSPNGALIFRPIGWIGAKEETKLLPLSQRKRWSPQKLPLYLIRRSRPEIKKSLGRNAIRSKMRSHIPCPSFPS